MGVEGGNNMVVFVENNLGRHLALIVSISDAVSDLKKKIEAELPLYYPDIEEVKVESLKVRREGELYCVSDSMPVDAFCEANGSCFVRIETRERVNGGGFLGSGNAVGDGVKLIECRDVRDSDWNGRDGVFNRGGDLEARSNQDKKKYKRGKRKRKGADASLLDLDHGRPKSTLDPLVAEGKQLVGIDKAKTDAVSMKESTSLVSGNGETTFGRHFASQVIRNSTLKTCSEKDPNEEGGRSKKKSRKNITDNDPPTFSGKDCNPAMEGSNHPRLGKRMESSKDDQRDNVEEKHNFSNNNISDLKTMDLKTLCAHYILCVLFAMSD